jgi:hypothetical protein
VQNPEAIASTIDGLAGRGATALVVLTEALFWNQRKICWPAQRRIVWSPPIPIANTSTTAD